MNDFETHFTSEDDSNVEKVSESASREISLETLRVIESSRDQKALKVIEGLSQSVDLLDKSKNVELLESMMRNGQWYPVCHYVLKNNLINPDDLYKIFIPSYDVNNNPANPAGLRYLLISLLKDGLLNMEQIINFIDGLSENSDIEVIWTIGKDGPIDPTNKRVRGMNIGDDFDGKSDLTETVNPNEEAHRMLYGKSDT